MKILGYEIGKAYYNAYWRENHTIINGGISENGLWVLGEGLKKMKYFESDIADDIYDYLFRNDINNCIDFVREFPDAEVNREFAYIKLNDEIVIKIERL